jgi:hypothetical protein
VKARRVYIKFRDAFWSCPPGAVKALKSLLPARRRHSLDELRCQRLSVRPSGKHITEIEG